MFCQFHHPSIPLYDSVMNEDGDSGGFQNTSYIQLCIIVLSTFQFVVFFFTVRHIH